MNLHEIKQDLEQLLRGFGPLLREGFADAAKTVETKMNANDLLTQYDVEVNTRILDHLQKRYPGISIISEEAPAITYDSEYAFVVDPIDGTRNFVRGIPVFFSGIGLVQKNKTLLCMTYNAMTDELFWAIKGEGAYKNMQRLHVSAKPLEQADVQVRAFGQPEREKMILENLIGKVCMLKNDMCCHYEISGVASDRFDAVVLGFSYPWDFCQYLLVEEAGGTVTDIHGEPYDISKDTIIASNGVIHQELLNCINS